MRKKLKFGRQVDCCTGCPLRCRYIEGGKVYDCHDHCKKYFKAAEKRLHRPYAPKLEGAEV